MPNLVNTLVHKELTAELGDVDGMLFVTFGGIDVATSEGLRTKLAEHGIGLRMIRNKIARRVLADRGLALPQGALAGNIAVAYGSAEDAILAAKVFTAPEVKKTGKIDVRAGFLSGSVLDAKDAGQLADVPDLPTLRAKILGCIAGPARGLATCLDATTSGFARLIKARAEKLEAAG